MLYHSLLLIAYEKFPLFCYLYFTFKFPFVKKLSVFLIRTCVRVWMLFSKHQLKHSLWLMKKHSLKILFIYFYREGKERREGEKHQCVVSPHMPPTGVLACNPGMCPDWESNWWPFGWQACTQSIKLHQPGCETVLWKICRKPNSSKLEQEPGNHL